MSTDFQHTGPAPHKDMEPLPSSGGPPGHSYAFTSKDLLKMLKKCSFCLPPEEAEQGALPMLQEPDRPHSPQTDRQTALCVLHRLGSELLTSLEQLRFPNSLLLMPSRADEAGWGTLCLAPQPCGGRRSPLPQPCTCSKNVNNPFNPHSCYFRVFNSTQLLHGISPMCSLCTAQPRPGCLGLAPPYGTGHPGVSLAAPSSLRRHFEQGP